jgi:ABC-type uncharacterized transport system auxiliary subunit
MRLSFRPSGLVFLLMTAACAVDLGLGRDDTPTRTYWLTPTDLAPGVPVGEVTVVAVPGLDTARMLALDGDKQLIPYAGARWNGSIPQLVRSLAERSLGGGGEAPLRLEVRRFFVEQSSDSPGAATVEIVAWRRSHREAGEFIAREELAEARLGAVVAAFQRALDQVMRELAAWLDDASEGSSHQTRAGVIPAAPGPTRHPAPRSPRCCRVCPCGLRPYRATPWAAARCRSRALCVC